MEAGAIICNPPLHIDENISSIARPRSLLIRWDSHSSTTHSIFAKTADYVFQPLTCLLSRVPYIHDLVSKWRVSIRFTADNCNTSSVFFVFRHPWLDLVAPGCSRRESNLPHRSAGLSLVPNLEKLVTEWDLCPG